MRFRGWLLVGLVATLFACGRADPIVGKWSVIVDGSREEWIFGSDGRFEYTHVQDSLRAKVIGTYRIDGDTVRLVPDDAASEGPHFESIFLRAQLMNPSAMKVKWDGRNAFDATVEGSEQQMTFHRS